MRSIIDHEKHGRLVLIADGESLTQRQLESFMRAYREFKANEQSFGEYYGAVLRAAVKAGWVVEPSLTVEAVDGLSAKYTEWLAREADKVYAAATTPDPKPLSLSLSSPKANSTADTV